MNKTIFVFRHEFIRAVRRAGYLIMIFIVPLGALAAIGVFALILDGSLPPPDIQTGTNMGNILVPGVFALLMALALMIGSVALINGLAEEKESRLIEVLFSSVSIRQLLIGKVLALGGAGLLQVVVWLVSLPLLLNLAASTIGGFLTTITIPPNFVFLGIVYFVLGYLLFSVFSIGLGAISSSTTEGSGLSQIYTLTAFVPLWFFALLNFFPESPIWVVLSFFPITAPIQVMLRLGRSTVPLWQILVSIGVLVVSITVGMIIAIRVFRLYMLMSGKRPKLGEVMRTLREA